MPKKDSLKFEFHVSRSARDRYAFDQQLFSFNGNVIFANFHAARVFAQKMNAKRDLLNYPEQAVRAGQINAMGLIDEILHYLVQQYREQRSPDAMKQAIAWLNDKLGEEEVAEALHQFISEFPPVSIHRGEMSVDEYLAGESAAPSGQVIPNREIVLEEMLMLWLANMNPAFSPFLELFDDANLEKRTVYPVIMTNLRSFFDTQPPFGPDNQNLIDMLRAPAIANPYSLSAQLEYIRTRWGVILQSSRFFYRLLSSLDLIKEEEKAIFVGPGPSRVYEFTGQELEAERFSPDKDWMPQLVLLAKNSYVWLDQLSKKYKRPINHLDEVPDEELDNIARSGFTGLWLIGLWERSRASKTIKQLRGNPDAVASAYSLYSYEIAEDLGGDEAYRSLRDRAWKRGIRLASDMVPNHMGIDSRWVFEHPDWFISLDYPPFPSYTFNGPNLSWDERVGIYLEDHYYTNTDAAVVFKRRDNWTGSEKFIYHGNDGTSMPWNDTAQLNYLNPEVREAVIQTILEVARKFPVIRFDAAMTLAKKHYQRLWYPQPGTGGDIPSRAEYGMTREQFDEQMPQEFWREVVDRVAQEVPDTLLLAEAFWLMEGYFVRTLGMHRVYNSAFMNMLRDEKNQEYRLVIKNTIEFEPEILKRYVNFMNNPDERTAVDQFGKGDKYFGICAMMCTMPGLPMFGHGQVEGYTEKYGMEFRRAYWDERPDGYLVERHEREIFPLLRRRYLFAEVQNFLLYDFYTPDGSVNEDVYAYSNQVGGERSLVLYHNKFNTTRGWIRTSAASKGDDGLVQRNLGEGLGLRNEPDMFTIFRDHMTGLEYIRRNQELHGQGLYAELDAYKYHVFLDFREVQDNEWRQFAQLHDFLSGRGVPSIDEALKELFLQPVHRPFRDLVNTGMFRWLIDNRTGAGNAVVKTQAQALQEIEEKFIDLLREIKKITGATGDEIALAGEVRSDLETALALPAMEERFPAPEDIRYWKANEYLQNGPAGDEAAKPLLAGDPAVWGTLFAYLITHKLGKIMEEDGEQAQTNGEQSRTWIDEFLLGKIIATTLMDLGLPENAAWRQVAVLKLLNTHQGWCSTQLDAARRPDQILQTWLKDAEFQGLAGINRYQGVLWFNKEGLDELLWWLYLQAVIEIVSGEMTDFSKSPDGETGPMPKGPAVAGQIEACYAIIEQLQAAEERSGYQVEILLEASRGL